ncbi:proteasome component M29, partial [Cryomyces antarcticus]
LSANEYHFLALQGNTDAWDPAKDNGLNLAETKVTAARFLASGVFTDAERFLPAVFASADSNSRISEVGDDMLKRALPNTDLENRTLITQLYSVYFGDPGGSLAARPALRIKLVSLFAKSLSSTTFPNQVIRIVEEALVSGEEDVGGTREISKLRSAIFAFINFVARHASPNDQHAIAPKVVYRLKDFIEVQGWPEGIGGDPTLRGYAYEVIGLLSKAGPTELLLEPNLDLLRWLFQSLREDTSGKNVTVSVEEALSSVLGAFTGSLDGTVEQSLKALLISQMLPGNGRSTSYVAVRFANRCLLYDALEARWIDLLAIGAAEGPEVIEEGRRGLDPYWYQMTSGYKHSTGFADSRVRFPKFVDFVDYVFIDHDPADATGLEGLEMAS